jgi:hypothetical protein
MNDHSDNVEGSFSYTVTVESDAGATGTASGTADLKIACTSVEVAFDKSVSFDIPESSYNEEVWPGPYDNEYSTEYALMISDDDYLTGPGLTCY